MVVEVPKGPLIFFIIFLNFHTFDTWRRRGGMSDPYLGIFRIHAIPGIKKANFSFDSELVLAILRRYFAALNRFWPFNGGSQDADFFTSYDTTHILFITCL